MDLELEKKYKETLKKASERIKALTALNETLRQAEPIAVIGMGCRFPGEVFTPQEFWQLLCHGVDTVTDIPADRWDVDAYYDPDRDAPGKMYTKQGAFLSGVDRFDPAFFGITPKEAESLDPQQRILLEVSWEMFEHAGLNPSQLRGSRTGVFIGQTNYDYIQAHIHSGDVERITPYAGSGVMFSTTAGRLSYFYDLQGPCLTVDTACSSSLVSLDLAVKHLQKNECDCAMAGGVNLLLSLESYISMCKVNALSPDGRCHAFDNQAQGYGRGEGCGLVLLKRLSDAMRDGDRVLSLIRGSAVNHDGRSNGLTAPNGPSQQRVIQQALADANLQPADVDYVEAHGTGTILGDPIEVHALDAVYGKAHDASHPLYIGSVKTNLGHTEASAGIAGIMKVVLSLQNKKIPPSLHFNTPNQHIAFDQIPIQVTTQVQNWESVDKKRVAAVSSFGLSGTNAHIILEEPPKPQESQTSDDPRDYHLLKVTAQSKQAIKELATRYYDAIANNPRADWLDFCYSANTGRQDLPERLVVGAGNQEECLSALRAYAQEQKSPHNFIPKQKMTSRNVVFLFTGQGAMYSGMGKTLYHQHPVFKQNLDRCADILAQYWDESLIDRLYQGDEARLCETEITQPALVAFEYALFKVWKEWGITPTAVLGHSIGEYTAAIVAGVMSLESALKLAVERGRRMQALPAGGAMAAVFAAEETVNPFLAPYQGKIAIAAYNAPERLTLSGDADAMRELIDTLRAENLEIRPLSVSHAFHSHHMHPMMAEAEQFVEQEKRLAPQIPFYSTLTGTRIDAKQLISRRYWAKQIIQPVLFTQAVKTMREDGYTIFLELGPTETLSLFARQTCGDGLFLSSLKKGVNDWKRIHCSAAQLYVHGLALNWQAVESPFPHKRVDVPTYPFQRKRYWLDLCPTRHKNKGKPQQTPAMDIREENQTRQNKDNVAMPTQKESLMDVRQILLNELTQKLAEVGGFDPQDIAVDDVLMELGLDSLMLVKMGQEVEKRFHVELTMRQFFQEIQSLNHLADYLMQHGDLSAITTAKSAETEPIGTNQTQTGTTPSHVTSNPSLPMPEMKEQPQSIMQLMQQQLQLMEQVTTQNRQSVEKLVQDQLAVLQSNKNDISPTSTSHVSAPAQERQEKPKNIEPRVGGAERFRSLHLKPTGPMTDEQKSFVENLVRRHIARTPTSKSMTQNSRPVLADWKHTLSYWGQLKEGKYPIISSRSQGPRFWDVDGNEYIDVAMGMGVHFLGHTPPAIKQEIERQLSEGMEIGTQCDLTGEVARLITELTGNERVTFCNTGSEAVMVCLRLARAVTQRTKIVIFENSYHGIFDGVLAMNVNGQKVPIGLGTPQGMIADVVVLKYGHPDSLQFIQEHAKELAGVLVEPVQSRNPDLQPQHFLKKLRRLTQEEDIALIFDEMITGFRVHPGGAQHWFGVRADICAYGKIVGGGLPIGVVAGKSKYMDYIDGGYWEYGDQSGPSSAMIFFGGTFGRNPMTMASAYAALRELKRQGPQLQQAVSRRTRQFCNRLNHWLEQERVPMRVKSFASQWRLVPLAEEDRQPLEMELLFLQLMIKGIYTWERRICFFSAAHGEEEINYVLNSIKESIAELRQNGFPFTLDGDLPRSFVSPTSIQTRLYALCQRPGGEKPYHLPYAYWVDGPLDVEKLEECMQEIIVRHETLRTCFHELDGELVAQIIPEPRFAIERYEAAEKDLPGIIDRFIRPFDLQTAPLLRMAVIQVAPQRFVFLNDAHHIGIDGLSFNFVVRDLMALYQGQSPPPVQHTFFECAALLAQRVKANQEKLDAFWDKELSGPLPDLALPTDFPRPKEPAYEGDHLLSQIESQELQKLKECAKQRRVSLYMLLVAAYTAFLHRLTGQEDILVGTPVAGRNCPEARETVGMFVNTTVLRNFPKPGTPFDTFLDEVKNTCSRVYDHEDYPFERMVERNNTGRPQNRNAIFDTTLTYENGNDRLFQISDLTFTQYPIHDRASMFDFRVEMIEEENCLHLDFQYNTQLFKRETIERWVAYFNQLLIQIECQPTSPLGAMDFLPESETQWLKQCNQTQAAYPQNKTLVDLFNKQVKETPHRTAVICGESRVTYEELDRRANQIATTLQTSHAIQPGDRVGVFLERSDWVIAAFLAILKTGGVYVPLDPEYPTERLRFILKDSECSIVLTQDSVSSLLPKEAQPIARDIQTLSAHEPAAVQATIAVDAPAYVIYTSGSTGQPKGCVVTHRNVVRLLKNERHDFDFNHNDIWSCLHSFCFDFSVWEMYGALLYGGCLAIADKATIQDPNRLLQFIRRHRVTVLNQTPPSFLHLMDREIRETDHNLHDHLRYVIFGGDRLSPASLKPWVDHYSLSRIALINMYGITETSVHVTFYPLQIEDINNPGGPSPIGRPIPETQVYVCNTMGMQQPIGVTGEMYVGGSGVCQGYLNRPELTHEKFIDSPWGEGKLYKSGDLARRLPNGNLLYLGRNDQQVQIRGHRIELGEIQNHLQHHAAVQKALVVSQENEQGHFELLAYYTKQEDISVTQLRDFLAQRLPAYMIPSYFIPVQAFPLTANGKIDRQALPHPQTAEIEQETDFRPPRDEIETTMAAVWRDVLGVDRVGVHDNYFVLGGDSIKAIQIVSRLFQEGIELEVRHILQAQTIARLREQVKQAPSYSSQCIKSQYGLEENEFQTVLRHLGVNAEQMETILPLTSMQEGILYHSIADENSNAYFEQFTYRIRGHLDNKIFEQTWNKLAKRHTALRTAILFEQTKEPVQVVLRERAIPFTYQDCRHLKQEEQRQKLEELQNQDRHHGFNLSQEPLMRMTVLQMEDGIYEIVWSHHHIILDGWSMGVLVDEFTQIYQQQLSGIKPQLPSAPSYSQYVEWMLSQEKENSLAFWEQFLRGYEQPVAVPKSNHATPTQGYRLQEHVIYLDTFISRQLRQLARENHVTVNVVMQTVWACILGKMNNVNDVVFGIVVSGRPPQLKDVEKTVGLFLQSIPLRVQWQASTTFHDLMQQVQQVFTECESHHICSMAEILSLTPLKHKLVDHMFVFENYPMAEADWSDTLGFRMEDVRGYEQMNYDFGLVIHPGEEIEIKFTYNANAHTSKQIQDVAQKYQSVVRQAVSYKQTPIHELPMEGFPRKPMTQRDVEPLAWWKRGSTVLDFFENQVAKTPDSIAVEDATGVMTYAQLDREANALAHALKSAQVGRDGLVGIFMSNCSKYVVSTLAVQKAGGVFVPLDPITPKRRVESILQKLECTIWVTNSEHLPFLQNALHESPSISKTEHMFWADEANTWRHGSMGNGKTESIIPSITAKLEDRPLPADSMYIMFTSGSTGEPKAILGGHDGLSHFLQWQSHELGVDATLRASNLAPVMFDVSLRDIYLPLMNGGRVVIPAQEQRSNLASLLQWLIEKQISLIHIVPSMYRLLLNELESISIPLDSFRHLRRVLLAGEPVFEKDIQRGHSLLGGHVEFINLYGPSETILAKLFHRVNKTAQQSNRGVLLGKPIEGAQAFLIKNKREAKVGEIGEIYIQTPFPCKGYYRDPEKTKEAFVPSPLTQDSTVRVYKTGDLGRLTEGGEVEFIGRIDRQVKINGVRVELAEVDRVLGMETAIDQSVVMVHRKNDGENVLVAYYTEKTPVNEDTLRAEMQQYLPPAMIPGFFVRMDKFPYNINGKIDRRALPKPDNLIYEREKFEPPQNEIEQKLVEIWKQVLGIEKVSVNSPFLHIGGNSLKAIRAISWINRELNTDLRIRTFFELATIRNIAQEIGSGEQKNLESIEPLPKRHDYPLSHAQRRLWILQQLEIDAKAYNLPTVLLMDGPFNINAFCEAMRMVVDRHESLRTTFHHINNEPRQVVHDHVSFAVQQVDLRQASDPLQTAKDMAREEAGKPFDLSAGPLIRVILYHIAKQRFVLFANIHHIVFDGTSAGVLIRDILQLYQSLIKKEEPSLTPLRIHYKDFAAWQNTRLLNDSMQAHRDYWQAKLAPPLPLLNLQTDFPRPSMQTFAGKTLYFELDPSLLSWFREFCHARGGSMYMGVVALIKILLYRYTGQTECIIGSVIAGRDHEELDDQVGFYVNTLVLRDTLEPQHGFDKNFDTIKQTITEAFEHREYPFDKIVDDLGLDRDMSRPPLAEIMVVYQNMDQRDFAMQGVKISELDIDFQSSKFPLSFVFEEKNGGTVSLQIEYNSDLFHQKRMENMVAHLQELLRSWQSQPNQPIHSINLLPTVERETILHAWNKTEKDYPKTQTLISIIEDVVRQTPDAKAVISESQEWSYRELNAKANQLAHQLRNDYNIEPGRHVGVLITRSPWLPVAFLGIQKAGAVYVPIDPTYPRERVSFMLRDCKASVILTDSDLDPEWQQMAEHCLDIRKREDREAGNPQIPIKSSDVAYVIYTSGSTGQPKGVLIENRGAVNLSHFHRDGLNIKPEDRVLQFAPASFDASVWEMIMAFAQGACLVVAGAESIYDRRRFTQYLQEKSVTVATLPPSYVADFPREAFSSLRLLITAGEAAEAETALAVGQCVEYVNAYGPTESTICASAHRVDPQANYPATIPIGQPIQNMEILVLDDNKNLMPMGHPGEIYIGGVGIARGYLNRESLTNEKFVPHPWRPGETLYRSGDRGLWNWDGEIEFLGRVDHQVKIRGHRIELGEIEHRVKQHPQVDAAVVNVWQEDGSSYLAAYLVSQNNLNVATLRDHAQSHLPDFMIPHYWVNVDAIPLLPNGKVNRNQLPAPKEMAMDSTQAYTAPETKVQHYLCNIWARVLGRDRVGIHDRFFELGGDSIKAIQIVALLQEEGYSLTVKELFRTPTIELLAPKLTQHSQSALTEITSEPIPFTPIQHWFFHEHHHDLHYFNQSVLLQSAQSLQETLLRKALLYLVNYHDSLRLVFPSKDGKRTQHYREKDREFDLQVVDVSHTPHFEQAINEQAQKVQESMQLEQGPLFKAALIRYAEKERLLLVAHHLIVDGVTWRIVIEDLTTAYQQLSEGREIQLPAKNASYQQWAEMLQQYSQSSTIRMEIPFWREMDQWANTTIFADNHVAENRYGDSETMKFVLSMRETKDLQQHAHHAYNTEINDLLLTALAQSLREWMQTDTCLIALEGHGREPIDEKVRVYRTAGWFTSLFPFALPLQSVDIGAHIKEVKEALRRIPQKGVGYGILKTLTPPALKQDWQGLAQPQIAFNYLGQFDRESGQHRFTPALEPMGQTESPHLERAHALEWDGYILNNQLQFTLRYHREMHRAETIASLLNNFEQALKTIIAHCMNQKSPQLTPSDVARVDMNLDDFENLFQDE